MLPQSKAEKTFELKEHLKMYLHLSLFRDTSGVQTQNFSDPRLVFLTLNQTLQI